MVVNALKPQQALLPIGIGLALSLLGDQTLYTVLPDPQIAGQAGVSLQWVGVLLGINRLTRMFSNGPAGMLYDRYPRRALMIGSISLGALSTLCYAAAGRVELLLLGRVLWGLAWSGIWVGSNSMALDVSGDGNRGRVNGQLQMAFFLGVAFASLAGGLFTDLLGYHGGLYLSGALSAIGILVWLVFLPETRPSAPKVPSRRLSGLARLPWRMTLAASLPYFALRVVFAGVVAATTILWLSQYYKEGLSIFGFLLPLATLTGAFSAARILISVISAPLSGMLSDLTGRRWAVVALLLLLGAAFLWMMSAKMLLLAVAGAILTTLTAGGVQGLVPAIVGDRAPAEQQSRVLGVVFTIGDFGSAIGPPLGLALIPIIGISSLYRLCALLFVLVALFAGAHAFQER